MCITGWPKPWFFMRVLIFMAIVYFIFYEMFDLSENARIVPGLIIMGSLVVPLATVFSVLGIEHAAQYQLSYGADAWSVWAESFRWQSA